MPSYEIESSPQLNIDLSLPSYECTVKKQGEVLIKHEFSKGRIQIKDCKWKKTKLSIYGTLVSLEYYNDKNLRTFLKELIIADNKCKPPPSYSLNLPIHEAHIESAKEYLKEYPCIFRIRFDSGEQFLVRSLSYDDASQWVDALLTSIDIATDIDFRNEPSSTPQDIILPPPEYRVNNATNNRSTISQPPVLRDFQQLSQLFDFFPVNNL